LSLAMQPRAAWSVGDRPVAENTTSPRSGRAGRLRAEVVIAPIGRRELRLVLVRTQPAMHMAAGRAKRPPPPARLGWPHEDIEPVKEAAWYKRVAGVR